MAHRLSQRFFQTFGSAISFTAPDKNTSKYQACQTVNGKTQEQEAVADPNLLLDNSVSPTDLIRSQISSVTLNPFDDDTTELVNGQVESAMEVEQESPSSDSAWTHKNPCIYLPSNGRQGGTFSEASHAEQQMPAWVSEKRSNDTLVKYYEAEKQCQNLFRENWRLQNQLTSVQGYKQEAERQCQSLFNDYRRLHNQLTSVQEYKQEAERQCQRLFNDNRILDNKLSSALTRNQNTLANLERLQDTNADLKQQYDELRRRYDKKVESYKKLDKNYMDLVRPLHVSDDDHSTIYSRLMHIRISIESLIQKARGESSANLNREAAVNHLRESKLVEDFPVEEAIVEPYHLNLYMESAIMTALIDQFFSRALECIFHQSKEFEEIGRWVEKRDSKIAARWRQQLCVLIAHDSNAMECGREREVDKAAMVLSNLVSRVYPNVDMSVKIRELCHHAFDLSFVMLGMESMIYPVSTPLGTPFDDTAMTTPQRSNPAGTVSLVIFPAFKDSNNSFYIKPKVWCS
ncbi:hypothetical protein BG011_008029 [Mortierella polycephala]|uniref:Uncharacterized protein n=1 Tax=Mortierella polycephala TaxID=41804 RepID=A0A9P6TY04_9FUNG|nr:hypothetical protein BG011_008029 [Mortierella polycephala]